MYLNVGKRDTTLIPPGTHILSESSSVYNTKNTSVLLVKKELQEVTKVEGELWHNPCPSVYTQFSSWARDNMTKYSQCEIFAMLSASGIAN